MAASLDQTHVEKKFKTLTTTQESIQSLSLWVMHHKAQHEKIVDIWFNVLKKSKLDHRLTLFYLCNDIVQNCRRRHAVTYKDAFKEVMKDATLLVRDNTIRPPIERIFKIWKERGVYDGDFIDELLSIINNTKVRATMNSKLLAEFQPLTLMEKIITLKRFEDEIELKRRQLVSLRMDASSVEAVRQLKDRTHGGEFCAEFESACTKMEDYVKSLEKEISDRTALIEMLEQSELYYDAQYGEAKIVANAYKNFGSRVNTLAKKLEDKRAALPDSVSPVPSPPTADAPSPSPENSPLPDEPNAGGSPIPAGVTTPEHMAQYDKQQQSFNPYQHYHPPDPNEAYDPLADPYDAQDDQYGAAYVPQYPVPGTEYNPHNPQYDVNGAAAVGHYDEKKSGEKPHYDMNTEAVDMEMSDDEQEHRETQGNDGQADSYRRRDSTHVTHSYPDPISSIPDIHMHQQSKLDPSDVAMSPRSEDDDDDVAGPEGSPLVVDKEDEKATYVPSVAKGASSSFLDMMGAIASGEKTENDGGSTPVMDEFENSSSVSRSRKESSDSTKKEKQNPIDFLTSLLGQSKKTTGPSDFLENLSMLTKTVQTKVNSDRTEQTSTTADAWAAWKALQGPPPVEPTPPNVLPPPQPSPPEPPQMPPPPSIHPSLLPVPAPPFQGPFPPPPVIGAKQDGSFPPRQDGSYQQEENYIGQQQPQNTSYPPPPVPHGQRFPIPGQQNSVYPPTRQDSNYGQDNYTPTSPQEPRFPIRPQDPGFPGQNQGPRFPELPVSSSTSATNFPPPVSQNSNFAPQTTPPSPFPPALAPRTPGARFGGDNYNSPMFPPPPPPNFQSNNTGSYAAPGTPTQPQPGHTPFIPPPPTPPLGGLRPRFPSNHRHGIPRLSSQDEWEGNQPSSPKHSVQFRSGNTFRSNLTTIKTVDDSEFDRKSLEEQRSSPEVIPTVASGHHGRGEQSMDRIKHAFSPKPPNEPPSPQTPITPMYGLKISNAGGGEGQQEFIEKLKMKSNTVGAAATPPFNFNNQKTNSSNLRTLTEVPMEHMDMSTSVPVSQDRDLETDTVESENASQHQDTENTPSTPGKTDRKSNEENQKLEDVDLGVGEDEDTGGDVGQAVGRFLDNLRHESKNSEEEREPVSADRRRHRHSNSDFENHDNGDHFSPHHRRPPPLLGSPLEFGGRPRFRPRNPDMMMGNRPFMGNRPPFRSPHNRPPQRPFGPRPFGFPKRPPNFGRFERPNFGRPFFNRPRF